ncbi:MAG: hypothetical protein RR624_08330 [Longicatena sp.]
MTKQDLVIFKQAFIKHQYSFFTDIFSKPIWGDMGEDCASITLDVVQGHWHLHFIRTQCGEPLPLSDTVCNVIDEYNKELSDDELYEFLMLHNILKEFEEQFK